MKARRLFTITLLFGLAAAGALLAANNSLWLGGQSLVLRAVLAMLPVLAGFAGGWLLLGHWSRTAARLLALLLAPVLSGGFAWFLYWMPRHADSEFTISMVEQRLITDSSSNALVEIGFAYPIFTPTVTLRNGELFSRAVDVYLRMVGEAGEVALYRAVRDEIPGESLSVETSVRGMLSANERYLFLPIALAPGEETTGRLVFVITALDENASFLGEMRRANLVQFELREAGGGELLLEVPIER